jgi:hypothetical protein
MKKIKYSVLLIFTIISSCQKNSNILDSLGNQKKSGQINWTGDIRLMKQIYDFNEKTSNSEQLQGTIVIQKQNSTENMPILEDIGGTNTFFYFKDVDKFSVNNQKEDFILNKSTNNNFNAPKKYGSSDIYGKKLRFNVSQDNKLNVRNDEIINWEESLYVPNTLQITKKIEYNESISKATGGELVQWIPDPNPENDKGVVVKLTYDPFSEKTISKSTNLPDKRMELYIVAPDNGKFVLKPEHLADFPSPLLGLGITIFRGNFKASPINNKIVKIGAYDHFTFNIGLK